VGFSLLIINLPNIITYSDVSVGWSGYLNNGVIDPDVFAKEDYNCALCNLALDKFNLLSNFE
jgi:hypothetical protein